MVNPAIPWERVLQWLEQTDGSAIDNLTHFVVNVGLPDEEEEGRSGHRGILWQKLAKSYDMRMNNPGLYQKLVATPTLYKKNIDADVRRSFPNTEIQRKIDTPENVLDKSVSYCQGMNYIVAVLLVYMEEEAAFWTLVNMMFYYGLAWLYRDDVATLADYINMFDTLAKIKYPKIVAHFEEEMFVSNSYITEWFTTLYVYRLPLKTVARVWDYFFLFGQEALFKVGIAIIASSEDLMEAQAENIIPRMRNKLANLSASSLLPLAHSFTIPPQIKRKLVDDRVSGREKKRREREKESGCIVV